MNTREKTQTVASALRIFHDNRYDIDSLLNRELEELCSRGRFCKTLDTITPIHYEVEIVRGTVQKWQRNLSGSLVLDRISHIPYPLDYGYKWQSAEDVQAKDLKEYQDVVVLHLDSLESRLCHMNQNNVALREGVVIGVISMIDKGEEDNKYIVLPGEDCIDHTLTVEDILSIEVQLKSYLSFLSCYKIVSKDLLINMVKKTSIMDYSSGVEITGLKLF